ncbi:Nucleotide-binding universal stress protein, UspA family [Halopelagius inordinatus]|uniref:Nucleotide-binding universal stress protein, UspA family n=1 Tax=Halopelagius inordinatus TaxID=553467 RepID=A0A1I2WJK6_9EURY|nr:universal stress protein [Halopelagius inordinatus]SFH01505.1 Nucleotide-binding universal stress protein, UspA family [Halopelagius inordinatus]
MYDRILFPTDGSDGASAAFDHVLDIAAAHDSTVYVLNVADTTHDSVVRMRGQITDVLEEEGERIVAEAADRAGGRGVDTVTEVVQGEPHRAILDYADARDVDIVVMPTRGRRGLERLLVGSTTERVVRRADVPVLTIRPDDEVSVEYPYRNVLVPTDGSDCAAAALSMGTDVATAESAALSVLSVVDLTSLGYDVRADVRLSTLEEAAEEIVEDAAASASAAGVESVTGTVEHGTSIHRAILSYVEESDIDLLVVGTHGRTGFNRYLLGSVTEKLLRTSPVPVLTVREPDEGGE